MSYFLFCDNVGRVDSFSLTADDDWDMLSDEEGGNSPPPPLSELVSFSLTSDVVMSSLSQEDNNVSDKSVAQQTSNNIGDVS